MLDYFLESLKNRLAVFAESWLSSGAKAYGVWENNQPLLQWPEHPEASDRDLPCLSTSIPAECRQFLELRVIGLEGLVVQRRLRGEAKILADLIDLEYELDAVTDRLVETQDQQLALYDLNHAVRSHLGLVDTLDSLASEASRLLKVEGAFTIYRSPDQTPAVIQQAGTGLNQEQILALFDTLLAENDEILAKVTSASAAKFPGAPASVYLIPIRIKNQVVAGMGILSNPGGSFTSPEMKLARAIADQGGIQIEYALLLQATLSQARVQTEMELAKRVQLQLLPQTIPYIPGLELAVHSRPALEVGGDFYDFVFGAARQLTFTVGDVAGKGMGAALLMSMIHTVFHATVRISPGSAAAETIGRMNEHLYDDLTHIGSFATLFVGQYDTLTRRVVFANAGHSPVIYCPKGGPARLLEADAPPIGVLPVNLCTDRSLHLHPGDLLIACTDGFTEAVTDTEEMFGYERLLRLVETLVSLPAKEILNTLYSTVDQFCAGTPQNDDQTVVVLKGVVT